MSKAKKKRTVQKGPLQRVLDNEATQLAQSYFDVITETQKASGAYASHRNGRRYFRMTPLDRLHNTGKITREQHEAGKIYRLLFEIGRYDHCRTMSLEELRGGKVSFDMPTRREDARDQWRAARKEIRTRDVAFADSILLESEWNQVHDRARVRRLARIRSVLDTLAVHFKIA